MQLGDAKEVIIGENTFFIRPFPPFEAIAILGDLQKLLGPALGKAAASLQGGSVESKETLLNRKVDAAMLGAAFEKLADTVDGSKLQAACKKLLNQHYIAVQTPDDSEPYRLTEGKINEVFLANLGDMFILIGNVLAVTYGDFFGKLTGLTGKLK